MRLVDALSVGLGPKQFRLHWELRERGMLCSGHTPERDERGFPTEEAAWRFAAYFDSVAPPEYVNLYVTGGDANNLWTPVPGYNERCLRSYP